MKWLLLIAGLLLSLQGFSQLAVVDKQQDILGKGRLSAGLTIGGAYRDDVIGAIGYFTPRLQYFLKDGWSVAVEGRYNVNGDFLRYIGVGLSSRYYFIRDRRLALFGQLGASLGQSKFAIDALARDVTNSPNTSLSYKRESAWQTTAGLGAHFRLGKRWALEGVAERAMTQFTKEVSYRRWQVGFGVNYLLK